MMPLCWWLFARAVLNGVQVSVEELYLHGVIVLPSVSPTPTLSPLADRKSRLSGAQMFCLSSLITFPCHGPQEVQSWVGGVVMGGGKTTNVSDVEAPKSNAVVTDAMLAAR